MHFDTQLCFDWTSDCNVTKELDAVDGQGRYFYDSRHKKSISQLLPEFAGANAHQWKGNLTPFPTGPAIIFLLKQSKSLRGIKIEG